ncbi:uncharacterized protein LOC27207310 [Drosophila simulans]|uniref:Uncharacterized protein LOC117142616 n=1 Tax=Drosophila mauritiana TaxID=7226 RepID=A0A6P8JZX8_DROMA|nr:uncharacterized protein LOC27207310 [Drosophila simulans]XP_033162592.1 uncharacterized protein LOC117142616 [Drosophila mauritiana]KMZ02769.1 uncharacterized protein Dsimw501_GD27461 [Drosophila simulans]
MRHVPDTIALAFSFHSPISVEHVLPQIYLKSSRHMKAAIVRIPIAIYFKALMNMNRNRGDRWRKMAELVFSLCVIDKAEDVVLDVIMLKFLGD